eukprot:7176939-Prymnesium_polylepis.1
MDDPTITQPRPHSRTAWSLFRRVPSVFFANFSSDCERGGARRRNPSSVPKQYDGIPVFTPYLHL